MVFRFFFILFYFLNSFFILSQKDWSYWGKNVILKPRETFYPNNIDDVIAIIKDAYKNNYKVKAIGSCHSWSHIINTDGYIINTDNLNKVLEIDQESKRVKVECGIKLKNLFYILAKNNLALPNQGFIDQQSIVGAISTGTHGTGHTGCLSDFIVELEVIDCFGSLHKVSESNRSELLPILRIGLGALGFIYSVTLQCQELTILNHKRVISHFDQVLKDYNNNYKNNDYYMFIMDPDSNVVLNFFWNNTKEKIKRKISSDIKNYFVCNKILSRFIGAPIIDFNPRFGKKLISTWLKGMQNEYNQYSYISLSPLKDPVSVKYYIEAEYAIDIKDFIPAIKSFKNFYKNYQDRYGPLVSLITCRFAPASNLSYLSMSYDRETAYITINIINYFDEYLNFFEKFEELLSEYNPRPHWGKFHLLNKDKVKALFKDGFDKFNNLRAELDPQKMFSNAFIENCFG